VSNDAENHYLNRIQVVPINSNGDRLYPSEAYETFHAKKSQAMADQIATVSKKRVINPDGFISSPPLHPSLYASFLPHLQ
jgi:mRNA interferase MazF